MHRSRASLADRETMSPAASTARRRHTVAAARGRPSRSTHPATPSLPIPCRSKSRSRRSRQPSHWANATAMRPQRPTPQHDYPLTSVEDVRHGDEKLVIDITKCLVPVLSTLHGNHPLSPFRCVLTTKF